MLVPEQNYLETQLGKSYYYSVFVHMIMDNDVFNVNSRPSIICLSKLIYYSFSY